MYTLRVCVCVCVRVFFGLYICTCVCFVYFRPNSNEPSPPQVSTEISDNTQGKIGAALNRQSSDELNAQQAKRKFSLSQYKEHKRLKSNEIQHNTSADTDMRIMNNNNNSKVRIDENFSIDKSKIILAFTTNVH